MKTNLDIFTFVMPVSLSCLFTAHAPPSPQEYLQMQQQSIKKQDGLACKLTLQEIKQRFKDNDLVSVGTRTNAAGVGFFFIYICYF